MKSKIKNETDKDVKLGTENWITQENFKELFINQIPILDVRAPVEFNENRFLNSVNIPILDDQQRAMVGTYYKQQGQAAAIQLGHQLVSGTDKDQKIQKWQNFFLQNPNGVLTCFRGGLRSRTTQEWLLEQKKISCSRVQGGTKALRQFLLSYLNQFSQKLIQNYADPKYFSYLISGATGVGKTKILKQLKNINSLFVLDLEGLAKHRGSAFGGWKNHPQPNQAVFENFLAENCLKWEHSGKKIVLEDESKLIGRCVLPPDFFQWMRLQKIILIQENLEIRIQNTFEEYVFEPIFESINQQQNENINLNSDLNLAATQEAMAIQETYAELIKSLQKIGSRLGHQRFNEILSDLVQAEKILTDLCQNKGPLFNSKLSYQESLQANWDWIEKLLKYYYDPMYKYSLEKRNPKILYQGTAKQCLDFLSNS